jgi:hypothetical protein
LIQTKGNKQIAGKTKENSGQTAGVFQHSSATFADKLSEGGMWLDEPLLVRLA